MNNNQIEINTFNTSLNSIKLFNSNSNYSSQLDYFDQVGKNIQK